MMRRVAIVLSSVPAPVAAKLLGSIDPQSKQKLRRTMTLLSDVDPLERQQAIEAFKVSIHQGPGNNQTDRLYSGSTDSLHNASSNGDRFSAESMGTNSTSSASPILKNAFPDSLASSDSESTSQFAFLGSVGDEVLADLLREEHPQAIALVMASIRPEQAGRVLPLLPELLRSQTLSRIGRLGVIPEEAASEMASHFRSRLSQQATAASNSDGKRKLDAILAAMPRQSPPVAQEIPRESHAVANANSIESAIPQQTAMPATIQQSQGSPASYQSEANVSAIDLSHRLRVVRDESDVATDVSPDQGQPVFTSGLGGHVASSDSTLESTDAIHKHLVSLLPIELCRSLGRVDTRNAMLTLCGLPNSVAEAALALLPKDQAKIVRTQMTQLNSLNLRDIDLAKEQVAQASLVTADSGSQSGLAAAA